MLDTNQNIKRKKVLAINAEIEYPETVQMWNLDNNIFSSRKHHQCISVETTKNICGKCEMVKYRQKWRGIKKNIEC